VPGNPPFKVQPEILDILGELIVVYMDWEHIYLCVVNVTWTDLDSLAFILQFLNPFWNAALTLMNNYTDAKINT
jgi:hypothetical protein